MGNDLSDLPKSSNVRKMTLPPPQQDWKSVNESCAVINVNVKTGFFSVVYTYMKIIDSYQDVHCEE